MESQIVEKDLDLLKKTVNSFISNQVAALERSQKEYLRELDGETVARLQEKASTIGLKALGGKKEWGGAGLSLYARAFLYEEAAKHRYGINHPAGDAFGEDLPRFLERCTEDQIETYVKPAVATGGGCFVALWEENEDNHLENISCTAVKKGDSWVVNGQKAYIQKLAQSSFGAVLVKCQEDSGEEKPTLFIVDAEDPVEQTETLLIDVQKTHQLIFKDVVLPDSRRIGEVGEGVSLLKQWIADSQILLSARCLGIASRALQYAKDYANMRITRGKPLSEFPSIRTMIADGLVKIQAARLMVHDAAKKVDQGEAEGVLSAKMAKLFTTETVAKIIDDTFQIHGGSGFAGDLPIERWYKEIRIARLELEKEKRL